jgi:hypothetical protein
MVKTKLLSRTRSSAFWRLLTRGLTTVMILIGSLVLSPTLPVSAQPAKTPKTCDVGVYLISLHDFDFANGLFSTDFWLWSTCPSEDLQPLKVVDFVNANTKDIQTSLYATYKRQNGYWSYVKVSGPFRHDWDVRNFPFDRHVLQITLENTNAAAEDFIYTADKKGSKYSRDIALEGWRITDFTVTQKTYQYATTFGDPELPESGTTNYSRLHILISIARDSAISFFKICAPVYIAFGISLVAYFLDVATSTGLLAATLFAVVVNQQVSESVLGSVETLTLVDQIHLTAMAYILATCIVIVYSHVKCEGDQKELPIRHHRRSFRITWISYVVVNIIIIAAGAIAG